MQSSQLERKLLVLEVRKSLVREVSGKGCAEAWKESERGQLGKGPVFEKAQAWNWRGITWRAGEATEWHFFFPVGVMRRAMVPISHNYGGLGSTCRKSAPWRHLEIKTFWTPKANFSFISYWVVIRDSAILSLIRLGRSGQVHTSWKDHFHLLHTLKDQPLENQTDVYSDWQYLIQSEDPSNTSPVMTYAWGCGCECTVFGNTFSLTPTQCSLEKHLAGWLVGPKEPITNAKTAGELLWCKCQLSSGASAKFKSSWSFQLCPWPLGDSLVGKGKRGRVSHFPTSLGWDEWQRLETELLWWLVCRVLIESDGLISMSLWIESY